MKYYEPRWSMGEFILLVVAFFGGGISYLTVTFGGDLEGYLFPVVEPVRLSAPLVEQEGGRLTVWSGEAEKLRGCDYVNGSLQWYLGTRGGPRVGVQSYFTDRPQVRGTGTLAWEGIAIDLDEREVRGNSHADVLHQCPWRPWKTRTRFYDSED